MEVDRRPTYALDKNFSVLKKNSRGEGDVYSGLESIFY